MRAHLAVSHQVIVLFNDTLEYNIAYGSNDVSKDMLNYVIEQSDLTDLVSSLPNGLSTKVGERGLKLSGGEKQRLSIARAILKNSPILILDEATSNVDNETEAALKRSINLISRNRTTIIIAHRLSTVRNSDIIAVLEEGEINELGTHEELLNSGGLYSRLWKVQTGEEIL